MRRYLTEPEVNAMIQAARQRRRGLRDALLIRMIFRHGLRVSEAVGLRWCDLDLEDNTVHIHRLKRGLPTRHALDDIERRELQALAQWQDTDGPLFTGHGGKALSRQQVFYIVRATGQTAGLRIAAHPHMLRHSCGFALANRAHDTRLIQDYLGHRCIQSTVLYTATCAQRFRAVWN